MAVAANRMPRPARLWLIKNEKLLTLIISGALIILGWLAGFISPSLRAAAMVAAAIVAGWRIAQAAWYALRARVVSIQLLVTIAAIGGVLIGDQWEAAAVTFLFALGNYLEARTLDKTRNALQQLMSLAPATAVVLRDGGEVEVDAGEVLKGEIVLARSGAKVPVDGIVVRGSASVNQAAITGESVPVELAPGSQVFSSTIVEAGYLEIRAQRVGEDTTFARILHMVEEAQERKAPTQKFIERFARWYTPAIIALAISTGLITGNLRMALTLLVIGCPGALVISTPISMVAGIGNAAKSGVLVKGGEFLEKAGKVTLVAFDKTGTLTVGRPDVTAVLVVEGSEEELLRRAAAVEQGSEHHIGRAIVRRAGGLDLPGASDIQVFPGGGISGRVEDEEVLIGNPRLLAAKGIALPRQVREWITAREEGGETAVPVAAGGRVLGAVAIADTLRPEAREAIAALRRAGKKAVMLTGDNRRTAGAIAAQLGLDEVKAELLPQDKVKAIRDYRRQGHVVAMVGDGINDTPALAEADLGVAMGAAGTDAAIETADLTLMSDNLKRLVRALHLGKATLNNIRQNVAFAVAVVLLLVLGVLGQKVFLASGMLAHEASVMLVIFNAMRLRVWKPRAG
ncbi:MAG TPA: cation-translocating P-type ATPase [Bacillota bacterium]|nr:cation-translocating P-type ATPase [Bacillota bacterium]